MRTIKHILITGCIALAVSSCDYLDQQPYEYWQPEETFIDYNKTIQMLNSFHAQWIPKQLYSIPRRVYR